MTCRNKTKVDPSSLVIEAIAFHKIVFNSKPTQELIKKYIKAHEYYILDKNDKERIWFKKVISLGLDLEALEIVLRFKNQGHILVRKMKILIYLAESNPAYYNSFVNERARRTKAILILFFFSLRTFYKLLKGMFLLFYYHNLENENV